MRRAVVVATAIAALTALSAPAGVSGERRVAASLDWAYAVAIQPDGKIVVAGRSASGGWRFAVARYTARGRLDPSFGSAGTVRTAIGLGPEAAAAAVAVDRRGRILVAGRAESRTGVSEIGLARYTGRGRLDPAFGLGGNVVTSLGSAWARGVAIQANGRIVVAAGPGLARYTTRGRLDASFGRGGVATGGGDAAAVAIQADGKLVTAGRASGENAGFALGRYTPRGRLDPTFGGTGKVVTRLGSWSGANAAALDRDGTIVAAGFANVDDFGVARYTARGTLDATFGKGGRITTNIGFRGAGPQPEESEDTANAVTVQRDGRIVVAGRSDVRGACGEKRCNLDDFALVRYLPDGSLDATFGDGGKIVTPFGGSVDVQSLAIDARGRIVAVGGGAGFFAIARYTANGALDPTFGTGGKVKTTFVRRRRA
jgi:uncharacterized delta-60 repeat protein